MINPKVKDVLLIIGALGFVSVSLITPGLPMALKPIMDYKKKKEIEDQKKYWRQYNPYILRQTIRRLQNQKVIEIYEEAGESVVKLTEKGKTKLLKYKIENLEISSKRWDGKWRVIIYDVPVYKRIKRDLFRRFIKKLNLYPLQESVYLTPFECRDEIEYLRQYFGI